MSELFRSFGLRASAAGLCGLSFTATGCVGKLSMWRGELSFESRFVSFRPSLLGAQVR